MESEKAFYDVQTRPTIFELHEQSEKELSDNFLFGKETELVVHRMKDGRAWIGIGDKNLFGVRKMQLTIEGGKPVEYVIEGKVY